MEYDSIECISTSDGLIQEEIQHHHHQFSILKSHNNNVHLHPTTTVHDLLECPVCTNSMYPPIHQCHNGHTLCSTCKTRVHNRCPTCRQELGDIRCLALEKVAESLEFPCKYRPLGCSEIFPYYSKLKHELLCNFRPYSCPYAGSECSVVGDIPFLVTHLRDDHKVDMHSGCTFNHRYVKSNPREVENATWMLTVFNCFGQYFCLHFEAFQLSMAPVYMAFVRFMGDEEDARNYSYSLEDMHKTIAKLEKFSGQDFRRWQKKMHFYLTDLKVVYVLSTPCPAVVENETLDQTRSRSKWENADYICRGHILNGMSDSLFDIYQNVESAKELWDRLEAKYMAEDASSKKFLVGNFINYKMVDTRPVMEQYHELQRILGQFAQYGMKMDETISVSSIIDKLPPSWKDFKNNLKHKKEELTMVELGSHLQIEQSIRDMEKCSVGGTKTMTGSSVNMMEEGESSKAGKGKRKFHGNDKKGVYKKPKVTCWKCGKPGHFKKDCRSGKGGGKVKNEAGPSGSKDPGKQSG